MSTRGRGTTSARLPWKRGPAPWRIACGASKILGRLEECRSRFFSLREAARVLGVSTQPLRDWTARRYLKRTGPRLQYAKDELRRLVKLFAERAAPFGPDDYLVRFHHWRDGRCYPFTKLGAASFAWPKARGALCPRDLAKLAGCHASSVLRAINSGRVRGRRRTPCRWAVTKRAWSEAFPLTLAGAARIAPLPRGDPIPTREVAACLSEVGVRSVGQRFVRLLVRRGELEGVRPTPGRRKIFVTRASLARFREILTKRA